MITALMMSRYSLSSVTSIVRRMFCGRMSLRSCGITMWRMFLSLQNLCETNTSLLSLAPMVKAVTFSCQRFASFNTTELSIPPL